MNDDQGRDPESGQSKRRSTAGVTRIDHRLLALAALLFVAVVIVAVLIVARGASEPASIYGDFGNDNAAAQANLPQSGPDGKPPRSPSEVDEVDNVEIKPNGKGLPFGTWWLGDARDEGSVFLYKGVVPKNGKDYSDVSRSVYYVGPDQARWMRDGGIPTNVPLAVQTEYPGSPIYEQIAGPNAELPVGPTVKIKGVGTAYIDPAGYQAIVFVRHPRSLIVVSSATTVGDRMLTALKKLRKS